MEGWDASEEGTPTPHTLRRWRHFGRSGAGLVWGGEAFAVQAEGRANPNQLYLSDDETTLASLVSLRAAVLEGRREAGVEEEPFALGLQLTHSGRWSRPTTKGPAPLCAFRHPILDPRMGIEDDRFLLADAELQPVIDAYVRLAELAQEASFDFVDVKVCHGYLLHEFLSARSRVGPYGGDFDGRTRLFREIVAAIRAACPDLEIACRVSIHDAFPHKRNEETGIGEASGVEKAIPYRAGFGLDERDPASCDWTEPFRFLDLLERLEIRLVNLTLGSPYYCPHIQRPATYPPSDGYEPPEDPLRSVLRHLEAARICKERFPGLFLVGTGYSYLQEWWPGVAEHEVRMGHVDAVGLGRLLLSYPEMLLHTLRGEAIEKKRICRTFSDCTTALRNGILSGCFPLDPYYREMDEAKEIHKLRLARSKGKGSR